MINSCDPGAGPGVVSRTGSEQGGRRGASQGPPRAAGLRGGRKGRTHEVSPMSEAASLADHIDRQSVDILAHWRAAVGRDDDLPDAARLDRSEFDDHVPALLDRI